MVVASGVLAAALTVELVFPSIFGFEDAAPPFPPFPLVPPGGDDLRDEEEFAVKYLYLFPFPSPPPPDFEEKNEKARTCCATYSVVDVDSAATVEARETVGLAATSRANICEGSRVRKKERNSNDAELPTFRLALVTGRVTNHVVTCTGRLPH